MGHRITRGKLLADRFGRDEYGLVALPQKMSNVMVSRTFAETRGECGWCFPHGFENHNSTWSKNQRSWKKYRKTQYRESKQI